MRQVRYRGFGAGDVTDYAFKAREFSPYTPTITVIFKTGTRRPYPKSAIKSEDGLEYLVDGSSKYVLIPEGTRPADFAARVGSSVPRSALPNSLLDLLPKIVSLAPPLPAEPPPPPPVTEVAIGKWAWITPVRGAALRSIILRNGSRVPTAREKIYPSDVPGIEIWASRTGQVILVPEGVSPPLDRDGNVIIPELARLLRGDAAETTPTQVVVTFKPPPPPPVVISDTTYVAVSNSAPRVVPEIVPDLIAVSTAAQEKVVAAVAQTAATAVAQEVTPTATQADVPAAEQIVDVQAAPMEAGIASALPNLSMKWLVLGVAGIAAWIYLGPAITKAFAASPKRRLNGRE